LLVGDSRDGQWVRLEINLGLGFRRKQERRERRWWGRFIVGTTYRGVRVCAGGVDRRLVEAPWMPRAPARARWRPDRWAPPISVGREGKPVPFRDDALLGLGPNMGLGRNGSP
jgi:hypothetical protein